MGTVAGVIVALLVCAGAVGLISLRGGLPWEVAMLVLVGASTLVVAAGFAQAGLLDALLGRLEPMRLSWWAGVSAFTLLSLGAAFVLRGASLGIASLLLRWGVRVRPAPTSPVARRVQELRGREAAAVVWAVQREFLVPRQVVEELLQRER